VNIMPDQERNPGTDEDTDDTVVELDTSIKSEDGTQVIPTVSEEESEVETPEVEEAALSQLKQKLAEQKAGYETRIGKLLEANDTRLKGVKDEYSQYASDLQAWAKQQVTSVQDYYENTLEQELPAERLAEHYRKVRRMERDARDQAQRVTVQPTTKDPEPSKEPESTQSPELLERLSKLEAELAATKKLLSESDKETHRVTGGGTGGGPKGVKPVSARDEQLQGLIAQEAEAKRLGKMGEAIRLKGEIALLKAQR
jgi:hypothetical protein